MNPDKSYEQWIKHVFDRPVTEPPWHEIGSDGDWEPSKEKAAEFLIRAFEEPGVLETFSDAQLSQGFRYLISSSLSNYMYTLIDQDSLVQARGIRSIYYLFARLFSKKCSSHLCSINEKGANPLNSVCYMWWDVFPWHGNPNDKSRTLLDNEVLSVMEKTLSLSNDACRESALHGLGHWALVYPKRVSQLITDFISNNPSLRPELREYAEKAKHGSVN